MRIASDDDAGRENLARYLARAPFSTDKIRDDPAAQAMTYKTEMVEGPNRNFEIFDPLDFIATLTSHIPNRGEHLVRYYGYCSSVQRGRRQGREKLPLGPTPLSDDNASAKASFGNMSVSSSDRDLPGGAERPPGSEAPTAAPSWRTAVWPSRALVRC